MRKACKLQPKNMKELYETTKQPAMKSFRLVKQKEGETINKSQEHRDGWVKHIEELFNIPQLLNLPGISKPHRPLYTPYSTK